MNIRHNDKEIEQLTRTAGHSTTKSRSRTSSRCFDLARSMPGPATRFGEFEEAYAALLGRRHAIALANGTVALDVALHAIGLQPGDEVIVTPRSFVASASCVPMAAACRSSPTWTPIART